MRQIHIRLCNELLKWLDSIDLIVASDEKMSGIGKVYEVFIGEKIH